jgi:hypothetical protein
VKADKDFERRVSMRKALKLMAVLTAFGLTAWIGVVALAQGGNAPTPSTATTTSGDEVKGNCDEAEHANDPECLGVNPVLEDDHENDDQGDVNDDDQGEDENDDQGDVNDDDQGENEDNDDQGEDENDDQGDVNDDDQGENEDNDDQGENDDDHGEDQGDDDQGDNSGPGSENSGPGSSNSGDGG